MRLFFGTDAMHRSERVRVELNLPDPDEEIDAVLGGAGLLSLHIPHGGGSLHFLLPPGDRCVYQADPTRPGHTKKVSCRWVWGRATETYDMCLEYFGLGPFFEACWLPSERPPAPVRALGRAAGWLSDMIDSCLDTLEPLWPSLTKTGTTSPGLLDAWLSVAVAGRLANAALELDPAPCGHPACRWSCTQTCLFPDPEIEAGEVDSHGELELQMTLGEQHGSVWISQETWRAWGERAGWQQHDDAAHADTQDADEPRSV